MNLFSERYGYVSPTDALMYEKMPIEVVNALCTEFDALERCLNEKEQDYERRYRQNLTYTQLEESYFPTEADAHYMLIICSAFVNYIRSTLASVN